MLRRLRRSRANPGKPPSREFRSRHLLAFAALIGRGATNCNKCREPVETAPPVETTSRSPPSAGRACRDRHHPLVEPAETAIDQPEPVSKSLGSSPSRPPPLVETTSRPPPSAGRACRDRHRPTRASLEKPWIEPVKTAPLVTATSRSPPSAGRACRDRHRPTRASLGNRSGYSTFSRLVRMSNGVEL